MTLSITWLIHLFFIAIRLGTVLLFTPVQAIHQLPIMIRLMLVFALSCLLTFNVSQQVQLDNTGILLGGLAEFANGLILATGLFAAFAVFQIAGQLIDNETGLNSLAIFNPAEHNQESISSRLLTMLAVLFFFGMDGHLWLFKGLSYSFIIIPPGTLALFAGFTPIIKQFGFMFTVGFMIASPIILALLAVDLFGGLITRNIPQINTYFLILPLKICLGLFLLAMMLGFIYPISNRVFERCFQTWQELMS
ncbi:flagellar biosynthetic protein FliR [Legionella bononiensis]|uniref:Flagellar biosynthetic protein FliR n=1 Tax=Legionella bononiensis TaxID=2793102 RepID=A0ABS1WD68_9GAMM|nr:flagellar biosynthetic protein FliR [Legionella bononiensis]MBL7479164.1 flagellar biosynthetic protein FliR [Legionella bononiensis]MBL7527297.1 flagellar biosynthetic protein FliR [Legionella bononiensis]MBL7562266.1 flagellar biosynthetic protein FliR [Legionella bononiensis]